MSDLELELQRATAALERMGSQLELETVDDGIFTEFRDAVNRIRITGWMVEKARAQETGVTAERLLAQERIRCVTRMAKQLCDFLVGDDTKDLEGLSRSWIRWKNYARLQRSD